MKIKGPDDLVVGKKYRFRYTGCTGLECRVFGTFLRTSFEFGIMWFWWDVRSSGPYCFDYGDLNDIELIDHL